MWGDFRATGHGGSLAWRSPPFSMLSIEATTLFYLDRYAPVMGQWTCSVLTALFPILLLTVVVERRGFRESVRSSSLYRVPAIGSR